MKVGVCLKQVPSTDTRIKIAASGAAIDTADVKWEINPYDEFALEEALRLKDAGKATDVIVFTLGGADSEPRIRDALARGATAAIRLDDAAFAGSDSLGKARILAAAVKKAECGLVLCGQKASDDDAAQVPAMMAEILGWPQVCVVDRLEIDGGGLKATRVAGGGAKDVVSASLPAVITATKGLNEPRYASLKGIMMAKSKPIKVQGMADLGLAAGTVGAAAALVSEAGWSLPPERPKGRVLAGDNATVVKELVRLLREEAKVI